MSCIVAVEKVKKGHYRVTFDDQNVIGVSDEIVLKYGMRISSFFSSEELFEIVNESNYTQARNEALKVLNRKAQTQYEIVKLLQKKEFDDETIKKVIDFLKSVGIINDQLYAENFFRSHSEKKNGIKKIKYDLMGKGIEKNLIEIVVAEKFDPEIEFEKAIRLVRNKYKVIDDKKKFYGKIGRFLIGKGYEEGLVRKVLNCVLNESELD